MNRGIEIVKNHLQRQASPDLLVVICTPVDTELDRGMNHQYERSLRVICGSVGLINSGGK
ncbi:hypothetical protein NG796_14775 [Laspinema sp. A4]|nr:hypothetical protein [Laspinema sp. D2d]